MYEILIKKAENEKIALLENGKLVEYYDEDDFSKRREGNIYIGVARNIVEGMQSAFFDIGTERNSFIHLKDILKKVDETKEKIVTDIDISEIARQGQKFLVQVKKDSNDQKGARVSTHIDLPSKYIVFMPNTDIITVSQKITDEKEQERLIKLVKENILKGNGAVIRTSAVGKNQEIIDDIKSVEKRWQNILKVYNEDKENKPKLIAEAETITEKMILDLPEKSIKRIIVDNKNEYDKIMDYKKQNTYLNNTKIELETDKDIFDIYDLKKEIGKINSRKIWLNCGGFITIDKTEALTAIDVNTGKYTGTKNTKSAEQTIYKVNEEATIEIANQLRLRDIGGIIIIDYIDMASKEDKDKIQKLLKETLKKDRAKTQVEGFTKLDLMELTRKHICSHK